MRKVFAVLLAAVMLTVPCFASGPVEASGPYSAFDASKVLFNRDFVSNNHLADVNLPSHTSASDFKLAIDAAFLSVYTSVAKNKSDSTYSSALSKLNEALNSLYSKVTANPSAYSDAYSGPGTGLIMQAAVMMKKFNMSDLTTSQQSKVNYLYTNTRSWLNTKYSSTSATGQTYQYIVENQVKTGTGESTLAPFSVNIIAIHGGALALDSDFLYKNYGVNAPTDYPYRNTIANIGNYIKAVNFGNISTQGRLTNVGGARNYVDPGYISWHGMGLAQMAHGTVYTQFFSQRPSSTFMTEADAISKGFQTVYNTAGKIPYEFNGFGTTILDATDYREWLYAIAWTGDQATVDWIDQINAAKPRSPALNPNEPVIVGVAATSDTNFHRALSGLTAGMLKGLTFN